LHGRRETRHEEGVITARVGKRHRTACVAAQAIRHQPLIAGSAVPVTADLSAQRQVCNSFISSAELRQPVE
jgi:hypothetical protein